MLNIGTTSSNLRASLNEISVATSKNNNQLLLKPRLTKPDDYSHNDHETIETDINFVFKQPGGERIKDGVYNHVVSEELETETVEQEIENVEEKEDNSKLIVSRNSSAIVYH